MVYYKKISILNEKIIREKLNLFLDKNNYIQSQDYGFIPLNLLDVVKFCPELIFSLLNKGLKIKAISIYKTFNNNTIVHIDDVKNLYKSRLNIPILNCENTHTIFYDAVPMPPVEQKHKNLKLIPCFNEIEVDRVTIDQPTIIRVDQPHRVLMDEKYFPRICLTVKCDPDPIILLDKEQHIL